MNAEERRKKLLEKRAQIDAQLKRLNAQAKTQSRKQDARRKIIAGALALEHAEKDEAFASVLFGLLRQFVNRPEDRALFGLSPKGEASEQDNLSGEFGQVGPEAGTG